MYNFGSLSLARMEGVDKKLRLIVTRALRISSRRFDGGVDFSIPEYGGNRSAEDQQELFKRGVTKADGIEKLSRHQGGGALDVIPYVKADGIKGNAIYTKKISKQKRDHYFHIVATCMLQAASELGIRITWGGNWKSFLDQPHYQLDKNPVV